MGKGITAIATKFNFKGTQFTNALRDKVIKYHDEALHAMLQVMVENTPNFTGETQATFRQFRDYLSAKGLGVTLRDATRPEVLQFQYRFPKGWHIPDKIENLHNAGFVTAFGNQSTFKVDISRRIGGLGGGSEKFKITMKFDSGSEAWNKNPDLAEVFENAKEVYKQTFSDALVINLFNFADFEKSLLGYMNRVTIRST